MRTIFTLILLALPITGLVMAAAGLYNGPNYFDERLVTVESLTYETFKVTRMKGPLVLDERYEKRWTLDYSYRDSQGRERFGTQKLLKGDLPRSPINYSDGDKLNLLIPVDRGEGGYRLNRKAEAGLAISGIFSVMVLPLLTVIYFRRYPLVQRLSTFILCLPLLAALVFILFTIIR